MNRGRPSSTAEAVVSHVDIERLDAVAERHLVPYRGRKVCWRLWGRGTPLVLLHGGHGSWMHWVRNIESLATRHAVWTPDMPGFGESEDVIATDSSEERKQALLDALAATLDTLVGRGTPVDLAGFSFGGLVATELAAQRGAVRRLALLGTAGHGGARRQTTELADWRSAGDEEAMRDALRHNLAALMLHAPDATDELALAVHETSSVRTRFRSKAMSRSASVQTALARYGGLCLLLWGEHDMTAVPEQAADMLASGDPLRQWCVVPGAGHWVQYERAREVNHLLGRWFAEQGFER